MSGLATQKEYLLEQLQNLEPHLSESQQAVYDELNERVKQLLDSIQDKKEAIRVNTKHIHQLDAIYDEKQTELKKLSIFKKQDRKLLTEDLSQIELRIYQLEEINDQLKRDVEKENKHRNETLKLMDQYKDETFEEAKLSLSLELYAVCQALGDELPEVLLRYGEYNGKLLTWRLLDLDQQRALLECKSVSCPEETTRDWLNGEFFKEAFSVDERSYIIKNKNRDFVFMLKDNPHPIIILAVDELMRKE